MLARDDQFWLLKLRLNFQATTSSEPVAEAEDEVDAGDTEDSGKTSQDRDVEGEDDDTEPSSGQFILV